MCLPQDCLANEWSISTGKGFEHQPSVSVQRDESKELPAFLLRRLESTRERIRDDRARPALAGSVLVAGATGVRMHMVNGCYEPTSELCSGLPVYRNKDAPGFWLECCLLGSVYKYYVKQTEYRGEKCLTSYAYGACSANAHEVCLPQDCIPGKWQVSTGSGFTLQPTLTIQCVYSGVLPNDLTNILQDKREQIAAHLARPPIAGSVIIEGASGARDYMVSAGNMELNFHILCLPGIWPK